MELPAALRDAIDHMLHGRSQSGLARDAQSLSLRYRKREGNGSTLVRNGDEAVAYAASRMPATYAAVLNALRQAAEPGGLSIRTVLDAGAGTGAACWAAEALLHPEGFVCLEQDETMLALGKELMQAGPERLRNAVWVQHDIGAGGIPYRADLVIASYVLNEIPQSSQIQASLRLWDAADGLLLLVEPGTPDGFACLQRVRAALLEHGAHIAAPCPRDGSCGMEPGDWCHFACRVPRSRAHRLMKGGEAPYEDEKYSYLALSRCECSHRAARVIRHPQIRKGHVRLDVCSGNRIGGITLSKKDGEAYHRARKARTGDCVFLADEP